MSNLIEFLTSKEIIIIYIIAGLACLICFIIYIVEKNNDKFRKRYNTKVLNKLVEEIGDVDDDSSISSDDSYDTPVIENESSTSLESLLEDTGELKPVVDNASKYNSFEIEPVEVDNSIEEIEYNIDNSTEDNSNTNSSLELEYTTIEPDQATAKLELKKIEEELLCQEEEKRLEELKQQKMMEEKKKKEEQEKVQEVNDINVKLNNYEEEQEASAIISLDEFFEKGKNLYAMNEVSQYSDEGDEPISLQDLEKKTNKKVASIDETFVIENAVSKEDLNDIELLDNETDNNKTISGTSTFKRSPIISPIFGIERLNNIEPSELELENTADYEKLDYEINKTNEFLMSLKKKKKKLD